MDEGGWNKVAADECKFKIPSSSFCVSFHADLPTAAYSVCFTRFLIIPEISKTRASPPPSARLFYLMVNFGELSSTTKSIGNKSDNPFEAGM